MAEKVKETRVELGEYGDKLYAWNVTKDCLEWSVPSPRAAVRAPEGYCILAADYAQIEVKIMAYASGDPVLIAAINSGKDIHSDNATTIFGVRNNFTYDLMELARGDHKHPRCAELALIRNCTKTTTFGVPYGAGKKRIALMTGMSIEQAEEFINTFFGTFHVLKSWLENEGKLALENGYSTSPFLARKRFYPMPSADDPDIGNELAQIERWAGNMPIQAGNADVLKLAMKKIYLRMRGGSYISPCLYDAHFMLVVHDEIVMLCALQDVEAVSKIMKECMDEAYYEFVPRIGFPGFIALGPEKYGWGVQVVQADIWAKA